MLSPSRPSRRARWAAVLRPRWLAWHAFAACAAAGMLWLGDWQLHRAMAGNELSWAYTFEWPLFAVLGAVFWVKTIREELGTPRPAGADDGADSTDGAADGGADGGADSAAAARRAGAAGSTIGAGTAGAEYAARLRAEARQHGRWHGLR
jgi:hypothetical protein